MLQEHLRIGKDEDIEALLTRFKKRCGAVSHNTGDEVFGKVEAAVREFMARGQQLAAVNSVFQAKRTVQGDGYMVVVEADFGRQPTLLKRLLAAFKK